MILLVSNQYISYKELSDKLNYILKDFNWMLQVNDLTKVMENISVKFPSIFNANRVNFWVVDSM